MEAFSSNTPLSYPCLRSVFSFLPFEKRYYLAAACPSVRSIHKKLPHRVKKVRISTEYPFVMLELDGLKWRIQQTGGPFTVMSPSRRPREVDYSITVFEAAKYYLGRRGTYIHTLILENCFFHNPNHNLSMARIQILRVKFSFGHSTRLMKSLEHIQFGTIEIINLSQGATIFRELQDFRMDSLRVATVKISDDSLFKLNSRQLDIYEFETDVLKFKAFCEKLKNSSVGSVYSGDFLWALFGIDIILNCLKESLNAEERYLDGRKCLCIQSKKPGTELNVTYEQLCGMEMFKYRFTAQVMARGSAKRASQKKRFERFVKKFTGNTSLSIALCLVLFVVYLTFFR